MHFGVFFRFFEVVGHDKARIQMLMHSHTADDLPSPTLTLKPKPSLEEQMNFVCSLSNLPYSVVTTSATYYSNICVGFEGEKRRPTSIRNKLIMAFLSGDKKLLFTAIRYYNECERKIKRLRNERKIK